MTAAPRVLVVSHLFPIADNPALGCFVHEQVRALREQQGIDVRVVSFQPVWMTSRKPWNLATAYRCRYRAVLRSLRWQQYEGVPVVYLPYLVGGFFRPWLYGSTCRAALRQAAPWLRTTFPFDLIHCHTAFPDGPAALALARRRGVPLVLTEHTGPFRRLMANWLTRRQSVAALCGAIKVYCVSTALSAEVQSYLPAEAGRRIQTLSNGVDLGRFHPPAQWRPNPSAPRLLSIMSLDDNKAPLLLLAAFCRLRRQVPGATLTLVGEGPLAQQVKDFLGEHGLQAVVTLPGQLLRTEVARLLRDECDLFVLSSKSETFGVVLIEALASGKPVVCTDCGGPRDIITNPEVGRLCPVGDEAALAEALLETVRRLPDFDPARLRRQAQRFALSTLAARLAQEYRGLLRQRAAA
jgi:glycosyltransferase involved in cell wall biosynthesis